MVGDRHPHPTGLPGVDLAVDGDGAPVRAELDGIVDELVDGPRQQPGVAGNRREGLEAGPLERVLGSGLVPLAHQLRRGLVEVERPGADHEPAGLHGGEIDEHVDDAFHPLR